MELRPIKLAKRILGIQHGGWKEVSILLSMKKKLFLFKYHRGTNNDPPLDWTNNDNNRKCYRQAKAMPVKDENETRRF